MMIHITDMPKPQDKFGSIPIRDGPAMNGSRPGLPPPRPGKTFSVRRLFLRFVGVLIGLTLFLGFGSFFLVPYLATTILAEQLSSTLNRPVTIPRAEFNPLTCTLTLHHLIVGPDLAKPNDPVDPLLSMGRMAIDCAPKQLLDGKIACTLNAKHCFLHLVRRKDGAYNLGQVMVDLLPDISVLPLRFSCNTIFLDNTRLVFNDEQTGKTYLGEDIALDIFPRTKASASPSLFHLQATINGTAITMNGTAGLAAGPSHIPNLPPAMPKSTEPGETTGAPDTPDDPAVKTAEALSLVRDLTRAAEEYLQSIGNPSVEHRTALPLP